MRLRKSDLIGLVGIIMLLAWTPGYMALDPAEKDLTGGKAIRLAPARDGLRVELEAIVQENGQAMSFGTVAEMWFESLGPGGTPVDARHRFVFEVKERRFNTEWIDYVSPAERFETYFDADGNDVWQEDERRHVNEDWTLHQRGGFTPRECREAPWIVHTVQRELHYTASTSEPLFGDIVGPDDDLSCGTGPASLSTVNKVALFNGLPLYGLQMLRRDQLFAPLLGQPNGPCIESSGDRVDQPTFPFFRTSPFPPPSDRDIVLRKDLATLCGGRTPNEHWGWWTRAFPVPAGHHSALFDAQQRLVVAFDVVPNLVDEGSGAPLPIRRSFVANEGKAPSSPAELIPLRDLDQDTTPLWHGLSIPRVLDEAATEASATVAAVLGRDPDIVGMEVLAYGREPVGMSGWEDGHPVALLRDTVTQEVHILRSSWTFTVIDGSRLFTFRVDIEQRPDAFSVEVKDECTADGSPVCLKVDRLDVDRAVVAPAALARLAEGHYDPAAGPFFQPTSGWLSSAVYVPFPVDPDDGQVSTQVPGLLRWQMMEDPNLQYVTSWGGQLNITTGATTSRGFSDTYETQTAPATVGTASAPPAALSPIATTSAIAGLLLVLVSLASRFMAAFKAGAHLPVVSVLYAKIHKDHLLDNKRRDAIVEYLRQNPGATITEIHKALGLGWGATVHHMETLRRSGHVVRFIEGHKRHHFVAGMLSDAERARAAAERDPTYSAFLAAVASHPGLTLRELSEHVPQGMHGASRTGTRLAALGLVEKKKDGRHVRFYPSS